MDHKILGIFSLFILFLLILLVRKNERKDKGEDGKDKAKDRVKIKEGMYVNYPAYINSVEKTNKEKTIMTVPNSFMMSTGGPMQKFNRGLSPMNYGAGYMELSKNTEGNKNKINSWLNYADRMDPDMLDVAKSLCSDLQTREELDYYGQTQGFVSILDKLQPYLEKTRPESIMNVDSVNRVFGKVCVEDLLIKSGGEVDIM